MSKIKQDKIPMTLTEDNVLEVLGYKYKLVRERDNLLKFGDKVGWVEWKPDGTFGKLHDKPAVGLSCILDPHRFSFTWLTTSITEIVKEQDNYVKFKTSNSTYELWHAQQENKSDNKQ